MPGETQLAAPPSQIWIISTLEICVRVDGRDFLVAQLSSYALRNQRVMAEHREGYWAPPFFAYPAPIQFAPPSTLGSLREHCSEAMHAATIKRDMEQLAYRLGLRDVGLEEREGFIELKVSPRSPDVVKAFDIRRFGLVRLSDDSIPNLADRQGLFGYTYLPATDDLAEQSVTRFSALHQREELWFAGKPIQSNLERVLSDGTMAAQVRAHGFNLDEDEFNSRDRGVVVACDLSGYGKALQVARHTMGGLLGSGDSAAERFSGLVAHLLQDFVSKLGTVQVQVAGDGIIAALPDRVGDSVSSRVDRVLRAWAHVVNAVEAVNRAAGNPEFKVGTRLAVHYGDYRHGRTAGPRSVVPGFDGPGIVEAARLEQGLANARLLAGTSREELGYTHVGVVSEIVWDLIDGTLRDSELVEVIGREPVVAKEFSAVSIILNLGGGNV